MVSPVHGDYRRCQAETPLSDLFKFAEPALLNDEQTPMVFVVSVLEKFFHMTSDAACELMLRVHHEGSAECGTYSHQEATRLVDDVAAFARSYRHPLQFVIDPKRPSQAV
jgi:ATP-dependent Clp protease adaptor protein ClpS